MDELLSATYDLKQTTENATFVPPLTSVILSEPERGTSEGESKNPESVSFTMPIQGVSTKNPAPVFP